MTNTGGSGLTLTVADLYNDCSHGATSVGESVVTEYVELPCSGVW